MFPSPLEIIKKDPPDILLSDVRMEQMDGISLCREMNHLGIGTKCILITGYQDFSVAMEATGLPNIMQILLKPTSVFTVTKAVQEAIARIEKERANNLLEERIRLKESENRNLQASLLLTQMLTENDRLRENLHFALPGGHWCVCQRTLGSMNGQT